MRIQELILDGFKSYPTRTQISLFDPSFNAITGLNGSGKSNILDAICFCLGLNTSSVSLLRAQSALDLIYKRGNAGVTRASVTIVFDNTDKRPGKCPVGMEAENQITVMRMVNVSGSGKYLVNGHVATVTQVQNMFMSVGLNVNNPNFLIMQGKITKLLSLSPVQILSLIAEAAGTNMFDERKKKAEQSMEKKQRNLRNCKDQLDEISSKLDKLRAEKRDCIEYQKLDAEVQTLQMLEASMEWMEKHSSLEKGKEDEKKRKKELVKGKEQLARFEKELEAMNLEVERLSKARSKELSKGGKVAKLEEELQGHGLAVAKLTTEMELKEGTVKDEEKRIEDLKKEANDLRLQRDLKKKADAGLSDEFASIKAAHDNTESELRSLEELYQTLQTGISTTANSNTNNAGGYLGKIQTAQSTISSLQTETDQAQIRIGHLEKELKEKEPGAQNSRKEGEALRVKVEQGRKEVEALQKNLEKTGWSTDKEQNLTSRLQAARERVRETRDQRDVVRSRLAALDFQYSDPVPNFDRSKVKGLVANLINIDPKNFKYSTALEICAGGRLYNVVVENEQVGSQLLNNGKLQKRVTLIPLNKISAFVASAEKLSAAKSLDRQTDLALSLVGYEHDVAAAMKFVFGNTLICANPDSAKAATFHKDVRMKSVTLEGDVYDPSGTLSGGSRSKTESILVRVQELRKAEDATKDAISQLATIEQECQSQKGVMEHFKEGSRKLELKLHELSLLEDQLKNSNTTILANRVDEVKKEISTLKSSIIECKKKQKASEAEIAQLEKEMGEFANNKESKLKKMKEDIAKRKTDLMKNGQTLKTKQKELRAAELESENMDSDIQTAETKVQEALSGLEQLKKEPEKVKRTLSKAQAEHDKCEMKLREETKMLSSFQTELDELDKAMTKKKADISDCQLKVKQLDNAIDRFNKEKDLLVDHIKSLEKQYPWISEKKGFFGQTGTPFDPRGRTLEQVGSDKETMRQKTLKLKRKLNVKDTDEDYMAKIVQNLEHQEKQEKKVQKMYEQVLRDKENIQNTVTKLLDHKREALTTTWEKVNVDFGAIFGDLLPGNTCKLEPMQGKDITEGLEVKVRLGQVWKASLTELSGGQRSLIALSLIMAMLQFKPAPMYILDEIDAALDLSHTQHIGHLFRTRFKGSQFIVVSLKEGLFNNANVLFRARFVNGTSVVERTVQRTASAVYDDERTTDVPAVPTGPRRSRVGGRAGGLLSVNA
ncbi:RecF/RecN/SMC protein [Atractiella rhizophila]|nr:RecF/RecN/SMC protein [Atractiella rhizophila]